MFWQLILVCSASDFNVYKDLIKLWVYSEALSNHQFSPFMSVEMLMTDLQLGIIDECF